MSESCVASHPQKHTGTVVNMDLSDDERDLFTDVGGVEDDASSMVLSVARLPSEGLVPFANPSPGDDMTVEEMVPLVCLNTDVTPSIVSSEDGPCPGSDEEEVARSDIEEEAELDVIDPLIPPHELYDLRFNEIPLLMKQGDYTALEMIAERLIRCVIHCPDPQATFPNEKDMRSIQYTNEIITCALLIMSLVKGDGPPTHHRQYDQIRGATTASDINDAGANRAVGEWVLMQGNSAYQLAMCIYNVEYNSHV